MARIKLAYIGGGSTRAPGTMASFVDQGASVDGSEVVLMRAGDMIYVDAYLPHYSDLNRSRVPRRAIIDTYNPAHLGTINEGRFPQDG